MSTPPTQPRIPYGEADFRRIRLNRWRCVDKTRFLQRLEEERYAFLIRPRRFGKSLGASVLENYYDRFWRTASPAPTSGRTRPGNRAATSPCASTFQTSTTRSTPAAGVHSFTHGGGFYRTFFATLKSGAGRTGGGLDGCSSPGCHR